MENRNDIILILILALIITNFTIANNIINTKM